jgi:hypothetical protein
MWSHLLPHLHLPFERKGCKYGARKKHTGGKKSVSKLNRALFSMYFDAHTDKGIWDWLIQWPRSPVKSCYAMENLKGDMKQTVEDIVTGISFPHLEECVTFRFPSDISKRAMLRFLTVSCKESPLWIALDPQDLTLHRRCLAVYTKRPDTHPGELISVHDAFMSRWTKGYKKQFDIFGRSDYITYRGLTFIPFYISCLYFLLRYAMFDAYKHYQKLNRRVVYGC